MEDSERQALPDGGVEGIGGESRSCGNANDGRVPLLRERLLYFEMTILSAFSFSEALSDCLIIIMNYAL